jgi:hypothetical protein
MSEALSKAPVTTPPARKLGMIDTLVARDQTAVFWFVVACAVAAGCAWYLVLMAEALKDRPPFVVMDTAGAYYVAPGMNFDTMDAMHENLAQLAVETLFERGPTGLARLDRVEKLFTKKGIGELQDILKKKMTTSNCNRSSRRLSFILTAICGSCQPASSRRYQSNGPRKTPLC